jgi:nucleotide-binding universal stress UspA family protein
MSQPAGLEQDSRPAAPAAAAVLVGVDGSDASLAAIQLAAREARYREVPLIAVRAYSGESPFGAPAARPMATLRSADDERLAAESSLRDAVREVLGEDAGQVQVLAVLGLAGRKIVETAHKVNAQLIVLATHGSASLLLGTVSQYVLRKAPCPVLIVPARPARLGPPRAYRARLARVALIPAGLSCLRGPRGFDPRGLIVPAWPVWL